MTYDAPPPLTIDVDKQYIVNMETGKGVIRIELFPKDAPKTVNNFVFLSREGYYDGLTFHRIIDNFMAQGGDPSGTGSGGPGYQFEDEFSDQSHVVGALSMANAGPNTNGSQFFIVYEPQPHLNGRHTVFGQVIEGIEVALALEIGDRMTKLTIEES